MKSCNALIVLLVVAGSVLGVLCQRNGWGNLGGWEGDSQGPIFGQGPPRQQRPRATAPPVNPDSWVWAGDRQRPRPTAPPSSSTTASNPGLDGNGQLIGCPCLSTPETNLVCGTDGNAYGNMAKLRCAQRCGHNVQLAHVGNCRARDLLTSAQRRARLQPRDE